MIIANLSLILTNRSWSRTILDSLRSPNAALWWVLTGAVAFLGLALYVPLLRSLFRYGYTANPAGPAYVDKGVGDIRDLFPSLSSDRFQSPSLLAP